MIWRIAKIASFMVLCLFRYAWTRRGGPEARSRFLRETYVVWARYFLRVFGVELAVEGRENLPPADGRPRIFMCNHQSQLDIPALVAGIEDTTGFVAKKELGRIPLLAYWMRQVGCVFIDRSDKSGARKSLEAAAATIGGNPLVVFPEGTRSKTGGLQPLKLGGLRMAVLAGARIVPVHVYNTRGAFEARPRGGSEPVRARLRFFPPLDARGMSDEKVSWLKAKDYVEECWREGERISAAASSAR